MVLIGNCHIINVEFSYLKQHALLWGNYSLLFRRFKLLWELEKALPSDQKSLPNHIRTR